MGGGGALREEEEGKDMGGGGALREEEEGKDNGGGGGGGGMKGGRGR